MTRQPGICRIVTLASQAGSQAPPDTGRAAIREIMDLVSAGKASMFYTATFSPLLSGPNISPTLALLASRNVDINYTSEL